MIGKPVVVLLKLDKLTDVERRQALESGNLIKEEKMGSSIEELAKMGAIKEDI